MTRKKFIASLAFREREAKRRAAQATRPAPKEGKIMNERNQNIFTGCLTILLVFAVLGAVIFFIWNPMGLQITRTQVAAVPSPTYAPVPTQVPVVIVVEYPTQPAMPTEPVVLDPTQPAAPTEPAPEPTVAACDQIQVSTDNGQNWINAGENLKTESVYDIGDRVTWTSRRTIVPTKAWDEKLTEAELKLVENTWVMVRFNACQTTPVIFAGGVRIGNLEFNDGALLRFNEGHNEFEIRNGELVLWFDEPHLQKDVEKRLTTEIRYGNFDIKSRLGLAVTDSLKKYLPEDILSGVQIVILP